MSYQQTFTGKFTFANAHCLEAGIDAFAAVAGSSIRVTDFSRDGLTIALDRDGFAPAGMYEPTLIALHELGSYAWAGQIAATFILDGTQRDRCGSVGRSDTEGLPPRHRRWDLYFAIPHSAAEVRALIVDGVDVAQAFPQLGRQTALHFAAEEGSLAVVEVLLDAGVAVDATDTAERTPLASTESAEVASRLIAAGANPNRKIQKRSTLELATDAGRGAVVRVLLAAGAKIGKGSLRASLAALLAGEGDLELLRARAGELALAHRDVIAAAIKGDHAVVVDLLLANGAVLPAKLRDIAIEAGAAAMVELALHDPGAVEACGPSSAHDDAMCVAAMRGHLAVMELLAAHGVPIHPVVAGVTTPLWSASQGWRHEASDAAVTWLLDRGAPIDARNEYGGTALGRAVECEAVGAARILVARGADPGALDAEARRTLAKLVPGSVKLAKAIPKAKPKAKPTHKPKAKPTQKRKTKPTPKAKPRGKPTPATSGKRATRRR